MIGRILSVLFACAFGLSGCGWWSKKPETSSSQPEVVPPGPVAKPAPPARSRPMARPNTLDGYKVEVAKRIASTSPDLFADPLPEMLKSIVTQELAVEITREANRST